MKSTRNDDPGGGVWAGGAGPIEAAGALLERVVMRARERTEGGRAIDAHQVLARRVARMATRVAAAEACAGAWGDRPRGGEASAAGMAARLAAAEAVWDVFQIADGALCDLGLEERDLAETLGSEGCRAAMREALAEANIRALGRRLLDGEDAGADAGEDEATRDLRGAVRRFACNMVEPIAESIHREDLLIPESILRGVAELGLFGMSIPGQFGGAGASHAMMIAATEELSAVALVAGSLITRPEILARALMTGGTEAQRRRWLPAVASGELMVAVAVTEPDVGSDVGRLRCRAARGERGGRAGYFIDGAKAWCTFAGRADILALLARTETDEACGHRGLSLFIVEKPPFDGREFEIEQEGGGRLTGRADPTPGYRGMHSFALRFERYFVPEENLIGGDAGRGKGFYLQMEGFAVGRLQTGGRGVGVARGALEAAIRYARERTQFGRPIAEFGNTQFEIGAMAARIAAARGLTYAAARAMDRGDAHAARLAAMAKLLASRTAVEVTQRAQVLHGGWGYSEEYPIARHVADALVLPLFEGVEPILEIKVIARDLLRDE